ncbi:hypothetical protein TIFTF001_029831 [Ficus carica]|uniref:Uncharacterized protein n=1 Tax=Ficus carica TaxID=3494 RepID=A0AA88DT22_FICCA|nr:hypothetical protein TIFTF001_029831 [Ficus carica]
MMVSKLPRVVPTCTRTGLVHGLSWTGLAALPIHGCVPRGLRRSNSLLSRLAKLKLSLWGIAFPVRYWSKVYFIIYSSPPIATWRFCTREDRFSSPALQSPPHHRPLRSNDASFSSPTAPMSQSSPIAAISIRRRDLLSSSMIAAMRRWAIAAAGDVLMV